MSPALERFVVLEAKARVYATLAILGEKGVWFLIEDRRVYINELLDLLDDDGATVASGAETAS